MALEVVKQKTRGAKRGQIKLTCSRSGRLSGCCCCFVLFFFSVKGTRPGLAYQVFGSGHLSARCNLNEELFPKFNWILSSSRRYFLIFFETRLALSALCDVGSFFI